MIKYYRYGWWMTPPTLAIMAPDALSLPVKESYGKLVGREVEEVVEGAS